MKNTEKYAPKLIFRETTRVCNLAYPHCRASGIKKQSLLDHAAEGAERFITQTAGFQKTIPVFSGEEPLVIKDTYRLIKSSAEKGLIPAVAVNAALITKDTAKKLKESGMKTAVEETGITEYLMLYSLEELKKTGMVYYD